MQGRRHIYLWPLLLITLWGCADSPSTSSTGTSPLATLSPVAANSDTPTFASLVQSNQPLPGIFFFVELDGTNIWQGGATVTDATVPKPGAIHGTQLTHNPNLGLCKDPTLSPDGLRLVYSYSPPPDSTAQPSSSGADIVEVELTTGNQRVLVARRDPNDFLDQPVWSADGRTLYYVRRLQRFDAQNQPLGQGATIEALDTAIGTRRLVVENGYSPALSPDGRTLAFVHFDARYNADLALFDLQTRKVRAVSHSTQGFFSFDTLRFSPDGTRLVFSAIGGSEDTPVTLPPAFVQIGYRPMAQHGTQPWDIWQWAVGNYSTFSPRRLTRLGDDQAFAAWSRDGQTLAFVTAHGLFSRRADTDLMTQYNSIGSTGFAWRSP